MEDNHQEDEGMRHRLDVIGEIVSRFRAKTIGQLRLKSSRRFVSLTTSKNFIQKHLQFAKRDINQYGLFILVQYYYDAVSPGYSDGSSDPEDENREIEEDENRDANKEIARFSVSSFLDQDFSSLTIGDPFPEQPWVLISNVNGIFCFHFNDEYLILWNPTTGVVKRTSSWNDLVGHSIRRLCSHTSCGFGFVEHKNEYFGMVLYYANASEYLAFIYSATTDSWKPVASFRGLNNLVEETMIPQNFVIVFVADKFHWIVETVTTVERLENQYIVSFDPETELYRRLEKPRSEHIRFSYLGALGTCLSWCCLNDESGTWEVWMLEDYNREETWKIVSHLAIPDLLYLKPMCRLPDGQLLLDCNRGVVCCDVNDGPYRVVEFPNEISCRVLIEPQIYLETMVSPADLALVAGA